MGALLQIGGVDAGVPPCTRRRPWLGHLLFSDPQVSPLPWNLILSIIKKVYISISVPIQRDQRALSSTDDLSPHDVQMVEIIIDARYQTLPEICHILFGTFVTFGLGTFVTVEN